jgi:hypothetical protein
MAWTAARNLSDLGEMTAQWLLGRIEWSPFQHGPPDEETLRIRAPLVRLNRSGLFTEFSQPADKQDDGYAQRACVSGFCSENLAKTVAVVSHCTELIVLASPLGQWVQCKIPITIEDYHSCESLPMVLALSMPTLTRTGNSIPTSSSSDSGDLRSFVVSTVEHWH